MIANLTAHEHVRVDRAGTRYGVTAALLTSAALGWWWSVRMSDEMRADGMRGMNMSVGSAMSVTGFLIAWLAMMVAMMFPAVTPVVKLYARASEQHRVAPLPYFVLGYLTVWTLLGVPAYFAWRALEVPLADGDAWAGRVAGGSLIVAGVWQLTPLKEICLRHCRSPISFFLRYGGRIGRPFGAVRMGASHGLFCVGCCWAMFAVLVAVGTMNIAWMLMLTVLIVIEKASRNGKLAASLAGVAFLCLGAVVMVAPGSIQTIT